MKIKELDIRWKRSLEDCKSNLSSPYEQELSSIRLLIMEQREDYRHDSKLLRRLRDDQLDTRVEVRHLRNMIEEQRDELDTLRLALHNRSARS